MDEVLKGVRDISNLRTIILHEDVLHFVTDEPNLDKFKQKVVQAVGDKHKKLSFVNVHHFDSELLNKLIREGRVIHGSLVLSESNLGLKPHYLFSYDLAHLSKSEKVKVSKRIHGSEAKIKGKVYRYDGLKNLAGNELVSNSTMLVSQQNYEGFKLFLIENNVRHTVKKIWIE